MSLMQNRFPHLCIVAFTALLVGSQSACSEQSPDAKRTAQSNAQSPGADEPRTNIHERQIDSPASPKAQAKIDDQSQTRLCRFEVDERVLVDGSCDVFSMGNGGYTLNTWKRGKPEDSHFAVVISDDGKKAEASWNADPDDDRAVDSLGTVRLRDGCWVNHRTKICFR